MRVHFQEACYVLILVALLSDVYIHLRHVTTLPFVQGCQPQPLKEP